MIFIHNPYTTIQTAGIFEDIGAFGWVGFPGFLLWFAIIFTGREKITKNKAFLPILFILPSVLIYKQWTNFLIVGYVKQYYGWAGVWSRSVWPYLYYLYYTLAVGAVLYLLVDFRKKTRSPVKKTEAEIVIISTLVAFIFGSLTDVVFPRMGIYQVPDIAPALALVWASGTAYAIAKYKFLTITPAAAADDIISTMTDALMLLDQNGIIVTVNKAVLELLKYKGRELLGGSLEKLFGEEFALSGLSDKIAKGEETRNRNIALIAKDGSRIPVIFSSSVLWGEGAKITGTVCIAADITEVIKAEDELRRAHHELELRVRGRTADLALAVRQLKQEIAERRHVEETLRESEEKYSTLVEQGNDAIIIVQDEIVKFANSKMAESIGLKKENIVGRSFLEIISPGFRQYALEIYHKRISKEEAANRYELEIYSSDGKTIPIEVNASRIEYEGHPASMAIIRDITERKRAESQLKESYRKLEKILEDIIYVIAKIVESKDQYTAGHQRRVAELACAIARDMGLSEERVKGIHMASVIHDIGKITIPSEILSKPGRLNDIELSMVRSHSQMGYDILKTIDFPWPIAQMVLQHHERTDGSGYPGAVSGKKLLLEAEILSVADVVEAMTSHRPYRPALGLESALEEISKKRGAAYHPRVVDACLDLFNKKHFQFT